MPSPHGATSVNLSELRAAVRRRLRDVTEPTLWSNSEIDANLNEAEREACVRALLIEDNSSQLTQIDVTTDETRYVIDPRVIDVISIEAASNPGIPFYGWTITEGYLVLDRPPSADDTLTIRCYRLPLSDMEADDDTPEIRAMHHDRMCDWAISLCYLVPDADAFDQQASDRYAARFTQSFGERHSALTMRNHRDKSACVVSGNGYI